MQIVKILTLEIITRDLVPDEEVLTRAKGFVENSLDFSVKTFTPLVKNVRSQTINFYIWRRLSVWKDAGESETTFDLGFDVALPQQESSRCLK